MNETNWFSEAISDHRLHETIFRLWLNMFLFRKEEKKQLVMSFPSIEREKLMKQIKQLLFFSSSLPYHLSSRKVFFFKHEMMMKKKEKEDEWQDISSEIQMSGSL